MQILTQNSSKRANFAEVQFLKHIAKFTIFGKHNLQTFEHNTLINKLMLIFILNCITGSDENYASHCLSTEETLHTLFSVCSLRDNNT